jgi:aryl-alcohol dehydrogenase-like predicted oxidoreductase
MTTSSKRGSLFTFLGTQLTVNRMGYGAMQLAGLGVWGTPKAIDAAIAVLRENLVAVDLALSPKAQTKRHGIASHARKVLINHARHRVDSCVLP